jgi:hypothetical protein
LKKKGTRRIAIIGNPGIGKTHFLSYVLFQLKKLGVTVLYQTKTKDSYYLFSSTGVLVGNSFEFLEELSDSNNWYLVDGIPPTEQYAFTLLATSPRKDNYKEFLKLGASTQRWMPVWSFEECEECRKYIFTNITTQELINLYDMWGGIPRYILEFAKDSAIQLTLEKAIATSELRKVQSSIGEIDSPDEISHKLIHIIVGDDYLTTQISFASVYVARKVAERYEKNEKDKLKIFLASSEGLGPFGSLRGILFEGYAHNILLRGGKFRIRCLTGKNSGKKYKLKLDPSQEKVLYSVNDIQHLKKNEYGRPASKIFESIDSVFREDSILFQITVSTSHPVKLHGLKEVIKYLPTTTEIDLYFVVPPDIYPNFKEQNYINKKNTKSASSPDNVVQYALEIPLK